MSCCAEWEFTYNESVLGKRVQKMDSSASQQTRRSTKKANKLRGKQMNILAQPRVFPQRVYLYLQLKRIVNLPVVLYPLELHLSHTKETLQKMSEHYTKETIIYEREFNLTKPVFTMGVMQDSIEDMNIFSDNPLVIALYQRIPRHRVGEQKSVEKVRTTASRWALDMIKWTSPTDSKSRKVKRPIPAADGDNAGSETSVPRCLSEHGEEDNYVEEHLEFLSRGYCDLLQLFQRKRFISDVNVLLSPEYDHLLQTSTSQKITPTTEWHMYSILPILKKVNFTNLVFITLESIYNANENLHERAGHLGISILIRPTELNSKGEKDKGIPWCTFYGFGSQVINDQNIVVVWESMKHDLLRNSHFGVSNNQMETNSRIKLPRLFRNLNKSEGVDMKFNLINPSVDSAIINNSLHRYVMTQEMREILETAVVHNTHELVLQLFDEVPKNVLYEGTINPSIFGYPNVIFNRFATVLTPVSRKSRKTYRSTTSVYIGPPMFSILRICFFQPLTRRNDSLDEYNESQLKIAKLRTCVDVKVHNEVDNNRDVIIRELYRNFDELIVDVMGFIVKNDITSIDEKPNYFCCNLGNLRNQLVNICGNDFNLRTPTKTNIEFREMLTHMYKELMDRIEGLLNSCSWENLNNCVINRESDQWRTRRLFEEYRNMCFIGDCVLAKQIFDGLNARCSNRMTFNFYLFLMTVEHLNFEEAKNYLRSKKESKWSGEYFVALLEIYVNYKLQGKAEDSTGQAFSDMMENLRVFADNHDLDSDAWVLLYCFYNMHEYMPGKEYTRWKFENLFEVPAKIMPLSPQPLFECILPMNFAPIGNNLNCDKFYEVFKTFARLGAYGFAEVVFNEIADEFTVNESYLIRTTLKMLQGEINVDYQLQEFPTDNTASGKIMKYYQYHINGSVEYSRRRYDKAINYFKMLLTIPLEETTLLSTFYLSLMRLALLSFKKGDYELSKQAYELCVPQTKDIKNFSANYGLGLSLYYLGHLEEAIKYLARSTENDVFIPDCWGFLAVINLRLDRNKTALNCWKIAKMYPEMRLNKRIYAELEKIKYSNVSLMVDDDCKPP